MESADQKILYSLATTVEATRIELDALRLCCQALFGVVSMRNDWTPELAAAVTRVIDADEAVMLNTRLSDQQLAQRQESILLLLPPNVQQLARQQLLQRKG